MVVEWVYFSILACFTSKFFFNLHLRICLERGRGQGEKERHMDWLPPICNPIRNQTHNLVCAQTGNWTGNILVVYGMLQSSTQPGTLLYMLMANTIKLEKTIFAIIYYRNYFASVHTSPSIFTAAQFYPVTNLSKLHQRWCQTVTVTICDAHNIASQHRQSH